jgi:plastocyanin
MSSPSNNLVHKGKPMTASYTSVSSTALQAACALCITLASVLPLAHAASLSVTVVDKEGKPAQDAVVVLVPSAKGAPKTPLPVMATIAQEKMQFIPAVTLVGAGAKVRFINNDPWDHHVRGGAGGAAQLSSATAPAGFELRLEGKPDGKPAKFSEVSLDKTGPQSAVLLGCFLHGSMRGSVYVSDSPWAAKTGANGLAQFDDLPEGQVQIKVWHGDQLVDLPPQQIKLDATPAAQTIQLQVVPRRRRV